MTGRPLRDEQRAVADGTFKPSDIPIVIDDSRPPGTVLAVSAWREDDKIKASAVVLENIGAGPAVKTDPIAGASYARLAAGEFARTIEVSSSLMVDVDRDGKPLGVEVLGDGDWRDGLAALAMAGRLAVLPPDGIKPELGDDEFVRRLLQWSRANPAEYREEMMRLAERDRLMSGGRRLRH